LTTFKKLSTDIYFLVCEKHTSAKPLGSVKDSPML